MSDVLGKVAAVPWKTLRNRRGQLILPHRFVRPLYESLRATHELVASVAVALDDSRWHRAAEALERAAEALREVAR